MPNDIPQPGDWRTKEYDDFMIREKQLNKAMRGAGSALNQSLDTYDFPDSVIDSSAIKPGSLLGDFRISSGSLSSRDYGRFGTGWSLNSDGTVSGITASAAPGGSNTQVQFNDNGVLAGASGITWNKNPSMTNLHGGLRIITASSSASVDQSIGGRIHLKTGDGSPSGGSQSLGGWFMVETGDASANKTQSSGGGITLSTGESFGTGTQCSGGDISLYTGAAHGTGTQCSGGDISLYTGAAHGTESFNSGGDFSVWCGDAIGASTSITSRGGSISLQAGNVTNSASAGKGGYLYFVTGNAAGSGDAGVCSIILGGKGPTSVTTKRNGLLWLSNYDATLSGNTVDDFAAGIVMDAYYADNNKGYTLTRHNYIELHSPYISGTASVTDACVFRFTEAAGTHKAVDAGSTKTSPGTVNAWVKVNVNSTIMYIPAYTSKTA